MSQPDGLTPSPLAPKMNHIMTAGTYYTVTDINGEEAGIECRDDPLTILFIAAYDEWLLMKRTGMIEQAKGAEVRVNQAFEDLPQRIKDLLPSSRSGIIITGQLVTDG